MNERARTSPPAGRGTRMHVEFRETVLALVDEPTRDNVARYLAASRALEQSRRATRPTRAA